MKRFVEFIRKLFEMLLQFINSSDNDQAFVPTGDALAYPGAIGAGLKVTGGRFGQTYKVTTLNATGAGSLYDALRTPGAKSIVFDVSGEIDWSSLPGGMGEICQDDLSIYGQTAPEGGITITGAPFRMGGGWGTGCPNTEMRNVKIEYVRFRNTDYANVSNNPRANGVMSEGGGSYYIRNCSFSFNNDQAITFKSNYADAPNKTPSIGNCTIEKCLFSENATNIILGSPPSSPRWKVGDISVIKNAFVNTMHRTPNMGGQLQYDVIGNVIFNGKWRLSTVQINNDIPVNYMYNHITEGANTVLGPLTNRVQDVSSKIYTAYNYHSVLYPTPQENDWSIWRAFSNNSELSSSHFVTKPYDFLGDYKPESDAAGYRALVLADVGANMYLSNDGTQNTWLDSYDTERIADATNFISRDPDNKVWTLPTLPNNTKTGYDTAGDGIPDTWKLANGYDINTNYQGQIDSNTGYSILELYLYGI